MLVQSCQILLHQCDPDNIGAHDHISYELATARDTAFTLDLWFYGEFMPATGEQTLPDRHNVGVVQTNDTSSSMNWSG